MLNNSGVFVSLILSKLLLLALAHGAVFIFDL